MTTRDYLDVVMFGHMKPEHYTLPDVQCEISRLFVKQKHAQAVRDLDRKREGDYAAAGFASPSGVLRIAFGNAKTSSHASHLVCAHTICRCA